MVVTYVVVKCAVAEIDVEEVLFQQIAATQEFGTTHIASMTRGYEICQ
jgi:hypothetical protein